MKIKIVLFITGFLFVTGTALTQNRWNITLVGQWSEEACHRVALNGHYAYVSSGNLLMVLDISDVTAPVKMGELSLQDNIYDIKVSGDYAYVANWNEGLRIIDISDPEAPIEAGFLYEPHLLDVALSGGYAYTSIGGEDLRIIDIADPGWPVQVGAYWPEVGSSAVAVSGNYAYIMSGEWMANAGFFQIINIEDPALPYETGKISTPNYGNNVEVQGNYAYVANYGLSIINIENPEIPSLISFQVLEDLYDLAVSGNYAYVADGNAGLRILNISDPISPVQEGYYNTSGHIVDVEVSGSYAFIAAEQSGFLILQNDLLTGMPENQSGKPEQLPVIATPNPFITETRLSYTLPEECQVSLMIYRQTGQKVYKREKVIMPAGANEFILPLDGLSAGLYFYELLAISVSGDAMYKASGTLVRQNNR